ncbi:hypothetical protein JCM10296v2_002531 [Rhodotorula toruloides]
MSSSPTESAPSYANFRAALARLDTLCVDLQRGTVVGRLSPSGHSMPRLTHPPYITALVAAIKSYVRTVEEHIQNEEVWQELGPTKRGKERGRKESSYAKAVVGSIAWLLREVEDDRVTSKRSVELYQESLVRLIEEGKSAHARSSSSSSEDPAAEALASLGTTSRRYHRYGRLPLYGLIGEDGSGRNWDETANPFVPLARA